MTHRTMGMNAATMANYKDHGMRDNNAPVAFYQESR